MGEVVKLEGKMIAAVLYGPRDIRVESRDIPKIGVDEVLVKVEVAGVCGSDLIYGYILGPKLKEGRMLGHEYSGRVIEVGRNVKNVSVGDRVGAEPLVGCGKCLHCLSGMYHLCPHLRWPPGFVEYQAFPWNKVFKLPDHVTYEEAALLDCVAVSVHALNLSGLRAGETATVLGAGTMGLSTMQVAKAYGAAAVYETGTYDFQLELAKNLGADAVINVKKESLVERIKELTGGEYVDFLGTELPVGTDHVFEAVGGPKSPLQDALDIVRRGGTVVTIGSPHKPVDISKLMLNEVRLIGSFSYAYHGQKPEFQTALDLLSTGKVNTKKLITHTFSLERIKEAFETAADKASRSVKVIVKP